jgi:hypothetical protein
MFNKKLLLVFSVLALGFTACPAPQTFGLRGTITAPAGSDVKGTIIMACNIKDCTEPRSANAEVFTVDTTGLTAQWNIVLFAPGKYQVIAVNAAQGLIGVYKNPTDNSNTVEPSGSYSGGSLGTNISITLVKGAVPSQALDLFKTELSSP